MIYCGLNSSSDIGKVPVPAPVPDPDSIELSFSTTKNCTKSCPFNVRSRIISQKVGLSFLIFCLFSILC
jgi:hypothetical protein